jgi:S1-C subfamily serine protease
MHKKYKLCFAGLIIISLFLLDACESFTSDPINPEIEKVGYFVGGSDIDIRSEDAMFYIQKSNDSDGLWLFEYEALKNSKFKFQLIDKINEIQLPSKSAGTCFSIGKNYVVTNQHVLDENPNIYIIHDDIKYPAEVVYLNDLYDLAILKIEGFEFPFSFQLLDSASIKAGQDIYTIGYPLVDMLGSNVRLTTGIINAKSGLANDKNSFQISAQIQPGNSGGPVVTKDEPGMVLGIATYKVSDSYLLSEKSAIGQNLNFANNCDTLISLLKQLSIETDNAKVHTLDDALYATAIVVSEPDKGKKLKKYVFSYNIETVPDQYLGDMKHVTKIDINLYSLDLEMPSATYNWAWVFNFQKAPMLKGRYRESFANFINFLENAETDTIKSPKLVGDLFLTDGEGTLIGFANSKKQVNDELLIPHKVNREEIATIGKFAFAENEQIQTVYVSEGIKLLDESSFYYCKNLKDIYLPQSLERIGPWALYGPSELTIHYAGTKRQWDNLTKGVKSLQLECCKVLFDETF